MTPAHPHNLDPLDFRSENPSMFCSIFFAEQNRKTGWYSGCNFASNHQL